MSRRIPPEERLQRDVVAYLALVLPPDATYWHTPSERGSRSRANMGVLQAMGVRAGVPDLLILHAGTLHGIELKARAVMPSKAQQAMMDRLQAAGAGEMAVCRSLAEVEATLRAAGIPLRGTTTAGDAA